jgi:hypothetical protein
MKSIYLLLLLFGLFLGACGDSAPEKEASTSSEQPALTESGRTTDPAPTESAPTAQPVANRATTDSEAERREIDAAVAAINENIGSYDKLKSEVEFDGATYSIVKYIAESGLVVKSEATGGTRNWEFFASPKAKSNDQLIYGTYYQKTDDPYSPITRSIYHLGTLMDAPSSVLYLDQEGAVVSGEALDQDKKAYKEAMLIFM